MICVAIAEPEPERMDTLRKWLVRFAVQSNCELELLRFTDKNPASKLEKYAGQIQIALVSLDNDPGGEMGKDLYGKNPDCRICYYRESLCELEPLLSSRPIGFYLWKDGEEAFLHRFREIYEEVILSRDTFRYETKSRMYLLPKRNILYFRSDLRYVDIRLLQGDNPRILAKLSEVEPLAGELFIRIHKSYLVNTGYVLWMDRKNHMVQMANGEQLPVSEAQYDRVCGKFRNAKYAGRR